MVFFLQVATGGLQDKVIDRLPTFKDLISNYGAFLTVVLLFCIVLVWVVYSLQAKIIASKDKQIARMDEKEKELYERLIQHLDKK